MSQDYVPFSEIVSAIGKLCVDKVTGTLFVATKANRSAQLMLDRGKIVFVYFFNKRGEEALELMSTISAGRYRFQPGSVTRSMPLPSTDAILATLSGDQSQVDQFQDTRAKGPGLSQEQKTVLETALAGFIGPMAGIVCEDHFDRVADLDAAIDALVAEIPSPEQAEKFKAIVRGRLG